MSHDIEYLGATYAFAMDIFIIIKKNSSPNAAMVIGQCPLIDDVKRLFQCNLGIMQEDTACLSI